MCRWSGRNYENEERDCKGKAECLNSSNCVRCRLYGCLNLLEVNLRSPTTLMLPASSFQTVPRTWSPIQCTHSEALEPYSSTFADVVTVDFVRTFKLRLFGTSSKAAGPGPRQGFGGAVSWPSGV
jgi:hypothetical protein